MQLLSDILLKNRSLYTLQIQDLIGRRLEYFKDQGLVASLYYLSTVTHTSDLSISECDLNRILFNILSFVKHHNNRLKVEVRNDSQFLSLSFSSTGRRFPSRQKGLSFLPQLSSRTTYLDSVSTLVRESGGHLHYAKTSSREWSLDLQIPLSSHHTQNTDFPPLERFSKHFRVLPKAPSNEGVFFNRFYGRLAAL